MTLPNCLHSALAKLTGKNLVSTPVPVILDQMKERRPLPVGRKEFEAWSDRIISGALLPGGEEDKLAFIESQKIVLAGLVLHLGPAESHKEDAYFIHCLRKNAANYLVHEIATELKKKAQARIMEKEAANATGTDSTTLPGSDAE